ncbi:hypothetical protein [Loktanella sp. M215]|uniref:hypothetical protein n=1 Tax=Loktanella sp. M215 TaxID=2675431 RepID=UPI001F242D36|nr:hypothetical protein [Loktanella sp. M215]MCF7700656.1 hypothetical protein [Loktanella sp. M215]
MPILSITWGAMATIFTTILYFVTDLRLLTCYILGGLCAGIIVIVAAGVCRHFDRQDQGKSPCRMGRRG